MKREEAAIPEFSGSRGFLFIDVILSTAKNPRRMGLFVTKGLGFVTDSA